MRGLSNALFVLGLIVLVFVYWPLGVLMLLGSLLLAMAARMEPKPPTAWVCPHCGNPVVRTASICPTCQGALVPTEGPLAPAAPSYKGRDTCPVCNAQLGLIMGGKWGCPLCQRKG
jgi:predicted amidophosphoribosyltransferase